MPDRRHALSSLDRRDAIKFLSLLSAGALVGCASSRPVGQVSSSTPVAPPPFPPEDDLPVGNSELSRSQRLLEQFRSRGTIASGGPSGVVMRTQWASEGPVVALADRMLPVTRVTIHHDGMTPFTSTRQDDAMRRLEMIRKAHRSKGWADIGYHYAVDPAGRVYQCRPVSLQGAHVRENNEGNLGVLVMGNYMDHRPSSKSVQGVVNLVAELRRIHRLGRGTVFTHQELVSTLCPGIQLQAQMVELRRGGNPLA